MRFGLTYHGTVWPRCGHHRGIDGAAKLIQSVWLRFALLLVYIICVAVPAVPTFYFRYMILKVVASLFYSSGFLLLSSVHQDVCFFLLLIKVPSFHYFLAAAFVF